MTIAVNSRRASPAPYFTDTRILKLLAIINGAVPGIILALDVYHKRVGADPVNFAILSTGILTLTFLFLTLLVTPLRDITHWNILVAVRRILGLYTFFYACTHLSIYFFFDRGASFPSFYHELTTRLYLLVGITALLLMVPLAVTSANFMIRRLGATRWKFLHRLIYITAILGTLHYCMETKILIPQQYGFLAALVILLGYRFVVYFLQLPGPKTVAARSTAAVAAASGSRKKFWKGDLRIASITPETPHVRTFRLVPTAGADLPFDYLPGQYLNLTLNINGIKVHRSFTIASTPTRPGYCDISVKREPAGTATKHLHDHVHEGDLIGISAPAGHFTFTGTEAKSLVLLAGGVGITPLMAVIRYLTDKDWPGQIHLVYAAKTEADIVFRKELDDLARKHPNLHLLYTLTNPGDAWNGHSGRIDTAFLETTIPQLKTSRIHVCGPVAMIQDLTADLVALGVPASQVKSESFARVNSTMEGTPVSVEAEDDPTAIANPAINFARSGTSAIAAADETVLEASERVGVPIPSDCRSGICGTCKTKLLAGKVHMETTDALTPHERANDIILACQAKPLTPITVQA